MNKPTLLFGMPTGNVGEGPYSVWIEQDSARAPEAFGFDTPDQAFKHIEKLEAATTRKIEALKTLIGDELLDNKVQDALDNAIAPTFRVYRMEPVSRVDVSTLPKLN